MLLIAGACIVLFTAVVLVRMRATADANTSPLGWMSERWLAEHRTSRSP